MIFSPILVQLDHSAGNLIVGDGVGVDVGETVGVGDAVGLGAAVSLTEGVGPDVGFITGAADLIIVPLFQTSLFPFLIQVKFKLPCVAFELRVLHAAPGFIFGAEKARLGAKAKPATREIAHRSDTGNIAKPTFRRMPLLWR